MRILWVKAGKLLPVDTGGRIRSYNLLRQLDRRNDLTFLNYYAGGADARHDADLRRTFRDVEIVHDVAPSRSVWRYLAHAASAAPYAVGKFVVPDVKRRLAECLKANQFDVAVCDFLSASLNFPSDRSTPVVLFQHNVEALLWKRQADHERHLLHRLVYRVEALKMARYERAALCRFDHVVAVSNEDRDAMARNIEPSRITVVPTGVDVAAFIGAAQVEPEQPTVMFLGSMDWEANVDAVEHFCQAVWPAVRAAVPGARFQIVGRNPTPRVRALADDSVEVTGTVPSVVEYLERAAVMVVPLRIGGGTRLKIFEAMAAGRAVVSTSVGAEGLDVTNGDDALLADDPESFGRAVVSVLTDRELRRRLGERASRTAARHDWSGIAQQFETVLSRTAATRTARPLVATETLRPAV